MTYQRTTTASRRAAKQMRYIHISRMVPNHKHPSEPQLLKLIALGRVGTYDARTSR